MKRIISLTLIGLLFIAVITAGITLLSPESSIDPQTMQTANQLIESGHYAEAAASYEQLIAQGGRDSNLYYNLGNAYYLQGDLGRAILNYQRAAQLAPRDQDIRANLALARAQVEQSYPEAQPGPLESISNLIGKWMTLDETAILALACWFTFAFLVLTWRQLRPGKLQESIRLASFILLLLVVVASLSLGSRIATANNQPEAVIVAPVVTVSSSPETRDTTQFQLYSGTEINLLETQGAWVEFSLPGETLKGWLPLEAVETIT